jgi:2-oxoglutarate ferredoxin oxidoreductase subunit beta
MAIAELNLAPENVLIVSGIGCGSKTPHFVNVYGFEGLHGRALAVATGAKLVNPDLHVIVITGDGDGYGIGGNHFLHTLRRNINVTHIVQNNEVYGLTKGQYSPTSKKGFVSPSSPHGATEEPINPVSVAIAQGATYVARGFAMDINHLKKLLMDGITHPGYALIDVFQGCPTYNKKNTLDWYKENLVKIDPSHDPTDKMKAMKIALEAGEKYPIGLYYVERRPTYESTLPQLREGPVVYRDIRNVDISALVKKYM